MSGRTGVAQRSDVLRPVRAPSVPGLPTSASTAHWRHSAPHTVPARSRERGLGVGDLVFRDCDPWTLDVGVLFVFGLRTLDSGQKDFDECGLANPRFACHENNLSLAVVTLFLTSGAVARVRLLDPPGWGLGVEC